MAYIASLVVAVAIAVLGMLLVHHPGQVCALNDKNVGDGALQLRRTAFAKASAALQTVSKADRNSVNPQQQHRVPCESSWRWDFDANLCTERGCTWDPSFDSIDWCYFDSPAAANITTVHVVQGCHLDVGFAETAPDIVNLWFDKYFPLAHAVGSELAAAGTNVQLKFTAQSWLVSLYINCPPDWEGIHCPSPAALANFTEAVEKQWITWHAFPFNAEPEFYNPDMFAFGVDLTHHVDAKLGVANKTVLSQRDVPGMTRSVIPILRRHGVDTISVGVNGGSTPPNLPQAFKWLDPTSGESVTALYLQGGYGGISVFKGYFVPTIVPGLSHAMIVDWRGDNAGPPPQASDLVANFESIQKQFPGAKVIASTFDDFAAVLNEALDAGTAHVPTITSEIGDTWIHGTCTDPLKHARARHAQRLRTQCLDGTLVGAGQEVVSCSLQDERVWNFSRLLLKAGEHTWGLDVKSTLKPASYQRSNWSNTEFRSQLPNPEYQTLVQSWIRQRRWAEGDALAALGSHPLAAAITQAWEGLVATVPSTAGYHLLWSAPAGATTTIAAPLPPRFNCGRYVVGFDNATGAIAYLEDTSSGIVWVDSTQPPEGRDPATLAGGRLGLMQYSSYDAADYTSFLVEYNYLGPLFAFDDYDDFDKVGIDTGGATHRDVHPSLVALWSRNSTNATDFLVHLEFPKDVVELAGAPVDAWLQVSVPHSGAAVSLELQVFNKTATRLPEASFLRFVPAPYMAQQGSGAGVTRLDTQWSMEKLGTEVDPRDVVVGGSKHQHIVSDGGVTAQVVEANGGGATHRMTIAAEDVGTMVFGQPSGFPTPFQQAAEVEKEGVASLLHSLIWNTNYPMWYPFTNEAVEGNIKYRYSVSFD